MMVLLTAAALTGETRRREQQDESVCSNKWSHTHAHAHTPTHTRAHTHTHTHLHTHTYTHTHTHTHSHTYTHTHLHTHTHAHCVWHEWLCTKLLPAYPASLLQDPNPPRCIQTLWAGPGRAGPGRAGPGQLCSSRSH